MSLARPTGLFQTVAAGGCMSRWSRGSLWFRRPITTGTHSVMPSSVGKTG